MGDDDIRRESSLGISFSSRLPVLPLNWMSISGDYAGWGLKFCKYRAILAGIYQPWKFSAAENDREV